LWYSSSALIASYSARKLCVSKRAALNKTDLPVPASGVIRERAASSLSDTSSSWCKRIRHVSHTGSTVSQCYRVMRASDAPPIIDDRDGYSSRLRGLIFLGSLPARISSARTSHFECSNVSVVYQGAVAIFFRNSRSNCQDAKGQHSCCKHQHECSRPNAFDIAGTEMGEKWLLRNTGRDPIPAAILIDGHRIPITSPRLRQQTRRSPAAGSNSTGRRQFCE
jgi:hypothetical protein